MTESSLPPTSSTAPEIPAGKKSAKKKENPVVSVLIAVLVAVAFRSLAFEPFNIPSGSMKSTLLVGDYIFVSKYSYGYSRYSFPFGPNLFSGRVFGHAPERGDVVVFKFPHDPSINYIKRLIGLPGDTIQMKKGVLYLNGKPVPKREIEPFIETNAAGEEQHIPQYVETLPGGVSYKVLDELPQGPLDTTPVYTVPPKHYMMLGDNRDNSQDSRVMSEVGFVPEENLVGPARMIFFSSRSSLWKVWDYRIDRYIKGISYHE